MLLLQKKKVGTDFFFLSVSSSNFCFGFRLTVDKNCKKHFDLVSCWYERRGTYVFVFAELFLVTHEAVEEFDLT